MASITDIIVAEADQAREAAVEALRKRNTEAPADNEVLAEFLSSHVAADGTPLAPAASPDNAKEQTLSASLCKWRTVRN